MLQKKSFPFWDCRTALFCDMKIYSALTGVAQWVGTIPPTKSSLVQFPVRAHAWDVRQISAWGGCK